MRQETLGQNIIYSEILPLLILSALLCYSLRMKKFSVFIYILRKVREIYTVQCKFSYFIFKKDKGGYRQDDNLD